ncbi:hypothetical protein A6V25_05185 [Nostoc sp. ATCC 53789]|nr:hypothetical protein A6V25_05185 [Nostoc sp. ATCC 53789]
MVASLQFKIQNLKFRKHQTKDSGFDKRTLSTSYYILVDMFNIFTFTNSKTSWRCGFLHSQLFPDCILLLELLI